MSRERVVRDLVIAQSATLKMPGLKRVFESLARQAVEEAWSYEAYLYEVLSAEATSRAESAVRERIKAARFPEMKTLGDVDFEAATGIARTKMIELAKGEWIGRAENLIFAGPIGTGKTHLAIALGLEAAKQRRRVAFHRAADLVRMLVEAHDQREVGRLHRRIRRTELLILDELGFVPFDRTGGELLFNLIAERYESRSVLITTNLAFSEWPKVFADDEKLTTALLDRLAHHAEVITTKGKSFRMRKRASKAGADDPTGAGRRS
ncbi:MAG: IS21-like element helper ATPase IstB [Deltaproteobacteria bacterium]